MLVISVYPRTTLQPSARACDLISMRSSVHQKSRVSGSSKLGTRSSSFTERAQTVDPSCIMNPDGYFESVRNGYSSMSRFSRFSGVLRCVVPANRNIPAVVRCSVFSELPINYREELTITFGFRLSGLQNTSKTTRKCNEYLTMRLIR